MTPAEDILVGMGPEIPLTDIDLEPQVDPQRELMDPYVIDVPFPHAPPGPAETELMGGDAPALLPRSQEVDLVVSAIDIPMPPHLEARELAKCVVEKPLTWKRAPCWLVCTSIPERVLLVFPPRPSPIFLRRAHGRCLFAVSFGTLSLIPCRNLFVQLLRGVVLVLVLHSFLWSSSRGRMCQHTPEISRHLCRGAESTPAQEARAREADVPESGEVAESGKGALTLKQSLDHASPGKGKGRMGDDEIGPGIVEPEENDAMSEGSFATAASQGYRTEEDDVPTFEVSMVHLGWQNEELISDRWVKIEDQPEVRVMQLTERQGAPEEANHVEDSKECDHKKKQKTVYCVTGLPISKQQELVEASFQLRARLLEVNAFTFSNVDLEAIPVDVAYVTTFSQQEVPDHFAGPAMAKTVTQESRVVFGPEQAEWKEAIKAAELKPASEVSRAAQAIAVKGAEKAGETAEEKREESEKRPHTPRSGIVLKTSEEVRQREAGEKAPHGESSDEGDDAQLAENLQKASSVRLTPRKGLEVISGEPRSDVIEALCDEEESQTVFTSSKITGLGSRGRPICSISGVADH